ncbi:MAG: cytochrome P450 [Methylocella sp.]
MNTAVRRTPPGPSEKYDTSQDLLSWMADHFERYGNIYKAYIYGTNVYVVNDPQYVVYVLRKNWENYKKGRDAKRVRLIMGNGLVVSEGELWKKQRRTMQPVFHRDSIGALTPIITSANIALLKKWEQAAGRKESVNVTRDTSLMVLEVVLTSIFGDDYEQVAPHFRVLSDESERDLQFAQTFRALAEIIIQVAAKRRAQNIISHDILGMLMEARDRQSGESMPDHQLVNEIITLIVAGHETTACALNWTWYLLSQNPEVERKLSKELSIPLGGEFPQLNDLPKFAYTRQVIDEALRLYPPLWLITRRAVKDDQLGEYFVPAGTEIYISPYLIQRHHAIWEAPDQFNPDRFKPDQSRDRHELAMLPFGAGPRNCIGEFLAQIEMQIHLITVAKKLRLRYVGGEPLELDVGVNLRSKHDFIMNPEIKARANCLCDQRQEEPMT